jgi:threonine dehydrogenase-like Zn-dependent dehydrogenase
MTCRVAQLRPISRIIAVDLVDERLARGRARGIEVVDLRELEGDLGAVIRDLTGGRGPDAVIDAIGMEAHGPLGLSMLQQMAAQLPDAVAGPLIKTAGIDRLASVHTAVDLVRRGGTVSLIGVYSGTLDPMPLMTLFDKQIQLRMGQANVKKWVKQIMPLLVNADPLGVDDFATHRLPLEQAPHAYDIFRRKADGAVKIMLKP